MSAWQLSRACARVGRLEEVVELPLGSAERFIDDLEGGEGPAFDPGPLNHSLQHLGSELEALVHRQMRLTAEHGSLLYLR